MRLVRILASGFLIGTSIMPAAGARAAEEVTAQEEGRLAGTGDYLFSGWSGPALRVFYSVPAEVTAATPSSS